VCVSIDTTTLERPTKKERERKMKTLMLVCVAVLLLAQSVYADVYLHSPRGGNNRYVCVCVCVCVCVGRVKPWKGKILYRRNLMFVRTTHTHTHTLTHQQHTHLQHHSSFPLHTTLHYTTPHYTILHYATLHRTHTGSMRPTATATTATVCSTRRTTTAEATTWALCTTTRDPGYVCVCVNVYV
jgi:hypothetical protein